MPENNVVDIEPDTLRARVAEAILNLGAEEAVADEVARHLVNAEQSGHASHGVLRIPQYAQEISRGIIRPEAVPETLTETPTTIVLDGHHGFGHYAAAEATASVTGKALSHGVGIATIRRTTHVGRLGEYCERLAESGLISIMVVGAVGPGVGVMAAFGSTTGNPSLNTNPWAIGFPSTSGAVVFDGSMTTIAEGKVHAARDRNVDLPQGSILDREGRPSVRTSDFYEGGTLTPLGGESAGHKGYGLALAAALLGGLAHADGSAPSLVGLTRITEEDGHEASTGGVTIIAVDPKAFGGQEAYAASVGRVHQGLNNEGALVPGEVERTKRAASATRITLPKTTWAALSRVLAESGNHAQAF